MIAPPSSLGHHCASSLNSKIGGAVDDEAINQQLKEHCAHTLPAETWQHSESLLLLHRWAEIFNREFHLDLHVPAIRVEWIAMHRLGTYRPSRNGFGLRHEITLNSRYLGTRPVADTLTTLCHELLHEWQTIHGKPGALGSANYHNKQFRQKAAAYGMIVDSHGHTLGVEPGPLTNLLSKHGVGLESLRSPEENSPIIRPRGNSKMQKYRCGCTTVRCAVTLAAGCYKCWAGVPGGAAIMVSPTINDSLPNQTPACIYIVRFAAWLSSPNWPPQTVEAGLESFELVRLLSPWVTEACEVVAPELRTLSICQAADLRGLFNSALDFIECDSASRGEALSGALSLLCPIDDILTALKLVECGFISE